MNKRLVAIQLVLVLLISICCSVSFAALETVKADKSTVGDISGAPGIVVANVTSSQSFVEEGFNTNVSASVENTASSPCDFNVSVCGNGITLNTQPVSLAADCSTVVSFVWNTTGFALGNYTLSAYVWPLTGEANPVNNNCIGATVLVTCPGDLTGHFEVNFLDITTFVTAYIAYYQTGQCNPAADFEHTGKLDFNDVTLFVAAYLGYYGGPTPFVTNGGLTLTMSIPQTTYPLGQAVDFNLSINNVSNHPISFERTASTFDFIVYNSTGIVYQYTFDQVFPLWAQIYTLAPGTNLTESLQWDQVCNLKSSPTAFVVAFPAVFPASQGTYFIVGEVLGMQTPPQQITLISSQP